VNTIKKQTYQHAIRTEMQLAQLKL
jgi:hypothetical protein